MQYVICYDISEDKIRTKVAKYLESFARRVQCSVFICESTETKMKRVRNELLNLTENSEKRLLMLVPMCQSCSGKLWLVGQPLEKEEFCIVA